MQRGRASRLPMLWEGGSGSADRRLMERKEKWALAGGLRQARHARHSWRLAWAWAAWCRRGNAGRDGQSRRSRACGRVLGGPKQIRERGRVGKRCGGSGFWGSAGQRGGSLSRTGDANVEMGQRQTREPWVSCVCEGQRQRQSGVRRCWAPPPARPGAVRLSADRWAPVRAGMCLVVSAAASMRKEWSSPSPVRPLCWHWRSPAVGALLCAALARRCSALLCSGLPGLGQTSGRAGPCVTTSQL